MAITKLKGVYLVIDPTRNWEQLMAQLTSALQGGLNIVQVWDHWENSITQQQKLQFLQQITVICQPFDVPVLMHHAWHLALSANLDGVHFDEIPDDFPAIQQKLKGKLVGITVGNAPEKIQWADEQQLSYISFCAVFPSSSVTSCELVSPQSIAAARNFTNLPIFLSGGIQPDNVHQLKGLDFDGVAIISGILDAENPAAAVIHYINELQKIKAI